jgi:hypothetical protein
VLDGVRGGAPATGGMGGGGGDGGWGREFVCSVGRFPYRVGEEREPQPQTGNKNLDAPLFTELKTELVHEFWL